MPERRRGVEGLGWREALLIGTAQAGAIVPGVSRSGVTISVARLLEVDRETAARFSFLLATPIVAGAALLKVGAVLTVAQHPGQIVGCVASAVFGCLAIAGLLRYVRARTYTPFVIYRFAVAGVIVLVAIAR